MKLMIIVMIEIDEGSDFWDDDGDGLTETEGDCADWNAWIYEGAKRDFVMVLTMTVMV